LLALTDLKIWLDSRPALNIPISGFDPSRLVFDLDGAGATAVIFKDLGHGSGSSDATFFLPAASLQNLAA